MPGQLPAHDTGHCVKTVTLGWAGAPNERTPFRNHDAVVGVLVLSIHVCRGLGISPLRTKTSAWLFIKPILVQHRPQIFFFRAFPQVGTFRFTKRAQSKLYLKSYDGHVGNSNLFWELCVSTGIGLSIVGCMLFGIHRALWFLWSPAVVLL